MHKEIMPAIELVLKGSKQVIFKEFLDVSEAATFLGVTKGWMYKLNYHKIIPYFKPSGKKIYYKKEDLINYISGGRIAPAFELDQKANEILKTICDVR